MFISKRWRVLFIPKVWLFGIGYRPDDGPCRFRVIRWWFFGPIEVRKFLSEGEIKKNESKNILTSSL